MIGRSALVTLLLLLLGTPSQAQQAASTATPPPALADVPDASSEAGRTATASPLGAGVLQSAAQVLGFAQALEADGDLFRAITEYRRFAFLFPHDPQTAAALMQVGAIYTRSGKFSAAAQAYELTARRYPGGAIGAEATLQTGFGYYRAARYSLSRAHLIQFMNQYPQAARISEAKYRSAWCLVGNEDFGGAQQELALGWAEDELARVTLDLQRELARVSEIPQRSPVLAGVLSGLLPGAGQAYAGRWKDAAISLLVNALFAFGTYQAWELGNTGAAVVLGMFELGFYLGNIFGGMNAAERFNQEARELWLKRLKDRYEFPDALGPMDVRSSGLLP